jgi:lipopolysaccharide biosynthesis protein
MSEPTQSDNTIRPRLIAFYLTQFHPIPENDAWWGKGFTEWSNVAKARPLFDGHYQPHLPADFGFYDLRVRATRHDQIRVAKQFGIDGFCYHYYWFSGKRLLEQPLNDMLSDPESDMPFCLCWANENWTRRWDAAEREVLIAQKYLQDDDLNFIKSLIPFFSDSRYIRIAGAPFLIVYRPQHLPDARKTIAKWREYCRSIGLGEIHLCAALTFGNEDYLQFGFDSGVEFPPHNTVDKNVLNEAYQLSFSEPFSGSVLQYQAIAQSFIDHNYKNPNVFKTVFPSWDNTPRTGSRAVIILNSSPDNYEYWLSQTIKRAASEFPHQERMVFINAWNEWAEGCHLEPDRKYQRQFLEATLRATSGRSTLQGFSELSIPPAGNVPRRLLLGDLRAVFTYHASIYFGILAGWLKRFPAVRRFVRWLVNKGR